MGVIGWLHRKLGRGANRPEAKASLLAAIEGNDATAVSALLSAGLDPTFTDKRGWSPIHYAVASGKPNNARLEVVEMLIAGGADPNARSHHGSGTVPLYQVGEVDPVRAGDSNAVGRYRGRLAELLIGGAPIRTSPDTCVVFRKFGHGPRCKKPGRLDTAPSRLFEPIFLGVGATCRCPGAGNQSDDRGR